MFKSVQHCFSGLETSDIGLRIGSKKCASLRTRVKMNQNLFNKIFKVMYTYTTKIFFKIIII